MLTKAKKQEIVNELQTKFKKARIAIFTDFRGVPVEKSRLLRRLLKQTGSEFKVAKKTLFDRMLSSCHIPLKTKDLSGEIGVVFGYGEETAPAKSLLKFSKENETFKILAGILGSRVLAGKEVITLARLPSREILLAQTAGALASPMRGLVNVLQGNIKKLVVVLQKIKDNK